mgnify:CR=1 FL=1
MSCRMRSGVGVVPKLGKRSRAGTGGTRALDGFHTPISEMPPRRESRLPDGGFGCSALLILRPPALCHIRKVMVIGGEEGGRGGEH